MQEAANVADAPQLWAQRSPHLSREAHRHEALIKERSPLRCVSSPRHNYIPHPHPPPPTPTPTHLPRQQRDILQTFVPTIKKDTGSAPPYGNARVGVLFSAEARHFDLLAVGRFPPVLRHGLPVTFSLPVFFLTPCWGSSAGSTFTVFWRGGLMMMRMIKKKAYLLCHVFFLFSMPLQLQCCHSAYP
jgi:hypothetical protein